MFCLITLLNFINSSLFSVFFHYAYSFYSFLFFPVCFSCGQVQVADIGLMGAPARKADAEGV